MGYQAWGNAGDPAQTYALSRLLPNADHCILREGMQHNQMTPDVTWVINGYFHTLYDPKRVDSHYLSMMGNQFGENIHYCGIHAKNCTPEIETAGNVIGARDSYTEKLLKRKGVLVENIGCATMTLPRYDGERNGKELRIESYTNSKMSQHVNDGTPWEKRWSGGLKRLDEIRQAGSVVTCRLHVIIPCLAFGTPVKFENPSFQHLQNAERFTILDEIGFKFGEWNEIDLTPFADRFKGFLYSKLGISPITPTEKNCPVPV